VSVFTPEQQHGGCQREDDGREDEPVVPTEAEPGEDARVEAQSNRDHGQRDHQPADPERGIAAAVVGARRRRIVVVGARY
jgi:hypothetical protein